MSKRVISFFLAAVMLLSLFSVASAETIGDGKAKTVTIDKGQTMNIFKTTSGVRLIGNAWEYMTDTGVKGPAYCINWGLLDPTETRKLTIAGRYTASPKTTGTFANGYPQRPLSDFKSINSGDYPSISSLTELEYAYATQLAVWASLGQIAVQGTSFTDGRAMLAIPSGSAQEKRIYDAMQIILKNAASWDRQLYTGMYFRLSRNEAGSSLNIEHRDGIFGAERDGMYEIKRETINGVEYFTRTFTVSSATSTYKYDYFIDIYASNAPEGTVFYDLSNKEFETVTRSGIKYWRVPTKVEKTVMNENGMEYVGDFKICIPVRNTPESADIQLHATSVVSQFNIYLANNSEDSEQSFIIADPMYITLTAAGEMKWNKVVSPYGRLVLNKTDGMGRALQGAVFELRGNDGSVHTGTSDANGQIVWEYLDPDVQYTLNETEVPNGYIKAEAQTLSVPEGQTLTVGVRNVSERRLTIRKIDAQNGSPLIGATFRIEQIDGNYKTDVTTGHSGAVEFHGSELPFGAYKVQEIKAPHGYVENSEPQTFEWRGTSDVTLTFKNVREMSLVIVKKDAETHLPLSGVVFRVYKDGRLITDVETDGAGYARVSGLQEGYYEVQETAAPEGYILDNTKHGIHINPYNPATEDDPVLVLTNTRKPSLTIKKYDSLTQKPMPDTKIEVYLDTTLIGTYETDKNGEIHLYDLKPGTYTVREIATDNEHIVNSTPQSIEITNDSGDSALLVFLNDQKPYMRLVKLDSQTMKPLANAVFKFKKVGGSFEKEYTTDENGEIRLDNLDEGSYIVTETKAPDGYLIDDASRIVEVSGNEYATFVFTNTKKPSLRILKYDAYNDKYLPGATFRIAKIVDGSNYLDRITDMDGSIEIDNLEPGVYSVKETEAPSGYVLNDTEYHVELFDGKESELVVVNEEKPSLKILKTDALTGDPIAGVGFLVKHADGSTENTVVTDENGEAFLQHLNPGIYEVTEKSVPSGYLIDTEPKLVPLEPNRVSEVRFENYPKPSLVIHKVDSITKDALEGAKFRITYASNNPFSGEINDLGVFQTDENGRVEIFNLKDGWYKIEETEAPDGYERSEETKEIYINAGQRREITFENTPLSGMVIKKVDGSTGKVLQGAKFRVRYLSGTSGTGGTVIGEYTTSANGTIVLNRLKAGTYVVEETKAPDGYVMSDVPETVYITGKEQSVVTVEFENFADSSLLITKLDKNTGEPLYGAVFKVTRDDGSVVGNANGRYTTDRNGEILISNLPTDTYIVTEVQAPDGYTLDSTPKTIKLRSGETHELTFYNESIGGLRITKLDEETRNPIRNVEFEVEHINGRRIGTYRTDSNGIINISGLSNGWYTVTETSAARGYIIDEEPRDVEVKDGGITRITVTNRKSSSFLIHKLDSATGKGIYGVTFLVSDRYGNPIATYTSDQNGYVYMDDRTLSDGKYYIREIAVPSCYVIDPEVKTFYVGYGETSSITWYNTPTQAQIQIIKKSADDNTINGLPAGSLLEGAVFEIYDRGGNIVDTIKTDHNGRAASKTLPLGLYTVRETQAPPYYSTNEILMTANLEFSGQIVTFEVLNKSVSTGVSITKTGYNEVMPNNPIVYTFKNIANTSSIPLESFYWRDTLPWAIRAEKLVTGTYNKQLSYKVVYRTNLSGSEYRTVNDNLSTSRNYALDISRTALGLASNEYITEIMFVFGTVPAHFAQVETPYLYARSINGLTNGTSFVNQADVGGVYNGQWITSVSRWVTKVYNYTHFEMPKTGY